MNLREMEIQEAAEAVINALGDFQSAIWCEVLARVVISVFSTRIEGEKQEWDFGAIREG